MAVKSQGLNHMGGDIDTGRVQQLAKVGKGDKSKNFTCIIAVKGGPAPIWILHSQHPGHGPVNSGPHLVLQVGFLYQGQQPQQDNNRHRRIIHIRIFVVFKLKGPAAGLGIPDKDLPVTANKHLFPQQPDGGLFRGLQGAGPHAAVEQGQQAEDRVPDRRFAGLQVDAAITLIGPVEVKAVQARRHHRMVKGVAFGAKGHQRIDPGRLDTAPGAVRILVIDYPFKTGTDCRLPKGMDGKINISVEQIIGEEKKTLPGEKSLFSR